MAHQSEYKRLLTGSTLRLKSLDYGWWLKLSNELRLTACEDKCSALTVSIFKNYIRSGKDFSRASIWDQPGLSSSIRLEVTKERRHSQNSWILWFFSFFSYVTVEQFELGPGQLIFKENIRSGKGLFYTTIWFQPEVSSSINLEIMKEQRLFWY